MTKELRAGVIGLGVGAQHIEALNKLKGCKVTAVCDQNSDVLEAFSKKNPAIECFSDAATLIDNAQIDLVCVASFDRDHAAQVVQAIGRGLHVFAEKPLCTSTEQLASIKTALATAKTVRLGCNLILRRSPRFVALKQAITQGKYGELYLLEGDYCYGRIGKITQGWRGDDPDYSIVVGGGVHVVDLLLWFAQAKVKSVKAIANKFVSRDSKFKNPDCVVALLELTNGAIVKVAANFGSVGPHFHPLRIYGTQASFVQTEEGAYSFSGRDKEAKATKITEEYPGVHKGALVAEFARSLQTGAPEPIAREEIFHGLEVCFAIDEAWRKHARPSKESSNLDKSQLGLEV